MFLFYFEGYDTFNFKGVVPFQHPVIHRGEKAYEYK